MHKFMTRFEFEHFLISQGFEGLFQHKMINLSMMLLLLL